MTLSNVESDQGDPTRQRRPRSQSHTLRRLAPIAPATLLMATLFIGPILWSIYIAFTNTGLTGSAAANPESVGLANFERFFHDGDAHAAILRSLIYVIFVVAGQNILGLGLALLMQRRNPVTKAITNGAVVCAWVMPEIVAAIVWYAYLEPSNGTLNSILSSLGLGGQEWLISAPMLAIVLASIWRGTAFSMLIYSAALEDISPEQIEAAEVDGATGVQRLIFIILPSIKQMALTTLLLTTLQTVGVFGLIFAMTAGGPNNETETLPIFMYNMAFDFNLLGYAAVAALALVAIGAIISAFYIAAFRLERDS